MSVSISTWKSGIPALVPFTFQWWEDTVQVQDEFGWEKKWTSLIIAILNISLLSPMGYWNFRVHWNHLGNMLKCRLLAITWRIPKSLYLNRGQEIWVLKMHRSEHRWSTNHILGHSAIWEDFLWLCLPQVLYCMDIVNMGLPRWLSDKEFICQCRRHQFDPWSRKIPWRRKWQPIPVILPGKIPWTEEPGGL